MKLINNAHYWIMTEGHDPFIAQANIALTVVAWLISGTDITHPYVIDHNKAEVLRMVDPFIRTPDDATLEKVKLSLQEWNDGTESSLFVKVLRRYREYTGLSLREGLISLLEGLIHLYHTGGRQPAVNQVLLNRFPDSENLIVSAKEEIARRQTNALN